MHGLMYMHAPQILRFCNYSILLAHDPLSLLAYPMITYHVLNFTVLVTVIAYASCIEAKHRTRCT